MVFALSGFVSSFPLNPKLDGGKRKVRSIRGSDIRCSWLASLASLPQPAVCSVPQEGRWLASSWLDIISCAAVGLAHHCLRVLVECQPPNSW